MSTSSPRKCRQRNKIIFVFVRGKKKKREMKKKEKGEPDRLKALKAENRKETCLFVLAGRQASIQLTVDATERHTRVSFQYTSIHFNPYIGWQGQITNRSGMWNRERGIHNG